MDSQEYNLKRFCSLKGIDIIREREVQFGKQFTLKAINEIVHLILFPKNILVQGVDSHLKEIMMAWSGKSEPCSAGVYDLPSGWREWNENANWISDFHKKHGVPKEGDLHHRYIWNREILFHDYMFRNSSLNKVSFQRLEFLIRAWFKRNCFMDLNIDEIIANLHKNVEKGVYMFTTLEEVPFSVAADLLSEELSTYCPRKYCRASRYAYCPQTERDYGDCLLDIVDALFPYFSDSVLSYTKGNLDVLLNRGRELKWISIKPSTPIEEKMAESLISAGILTVPQYQAWDEKHRYKIDFVLKTPQGNNIAIECDGLQYHAKASTYINDRKRDRYLQNKGFYIMRFSSVEIYNEIENVISEIDHCFWKLQRQQLDIRKPYRLSYFGYGEGDK